MSRYIVRCSCDYSISIEANSEDEALKKSDFIDIGEWDTVHWSSLDVEIEEDEEEPINE